MIAGTTSSALPAVPRATPGGFRAWVPVVVLLMGLAGLAGPQGGPSAGDPIFHPPDTATPSETCSGTSVGAGDDLAEVVGRAPEGSTLCISGEVFDVGAAAIVPKAGMRLVGAPVRVSSDGSIDAPTKVMGSSPRGVIFFENPAADVTLENLDISGAGGSKTDDAETKSHGRGVNGNKNAERLTVLSSRIHHNASLGIGGAGPGTSVRWVELDHNGSESFLGCCSGGIKSAHSLDIRDSFVHDNIGQGVWQDVCGTDLVVVGNHISRNTMSGVRYEHNDECPGRALIANNLVLENNTAGKASDAGGITVNSAPGATIARNRLVRNSGFGIGVHGGRGPVSRTTILKNVLIGDDLRGCSGEVRCDGNTEWEGPDR